MIWVYDGVFLLFAWFIFELLHFRDLQTFQKRESLFFTEIELDLFHDFCISPLSNGQVMQKTNIILRCVCVIWSFQLFHSKVEIAVVTLHYVHLFRCKYFQNMLCFYLKTLLG